ncbi:hypothetical protein FQZ97_1122340 [compost metagenome]
MGRFHGCCFDFRCAGLAQICADVEVRQLAFKQERDMRADRVAIIKDRHAMDRLHALDFGCKCIVIRLVKTGDAIGDVSFFRRFAVFPDGKAVKVCVRDQRRCVLTRIEADACRIAIGIDAIAMKGCADGRYIVQQPVIELIDVPVGVGENTTIVIES